MDSHPTNSVTLPLPAEPRPEATVWPLSAQVVAALLMASTLIALAWNSYLGSRRATRPTRMMRVMDSTGDLEAVEDEKPSDEALTVAAPGTRASPAPAAPVVRKLTERDPPLDLNTATVVQLQKLPGVGPAMAERIHSRRAKQPFRSVEDLRSVSGIGAKTLEKLRPFVIVAAPKMDLAATP